MVSRAESKMLTDVELELMTILWRIGQGSVSDVMSELPQGRELAYTSVSTILRILEQKKVLEAQKEGRGHTYVPLLKKSDYEVRAVRDVVSRVFSGTRTELVKQLLNTGDLSQAELEEIKALIDQASTRRES